MFQSSLDLFRHSLNVMLKRNFLHFEKVANSWTSKSVDHAFVCLCGKLRKYILQYLLIGVLNIMGESWGRVLILRAETCPGRTSHTFDVFGHVGYL